MVVIKQRGVYAVKYSALSSDYTLVGLYYTHFYIQVNCKFNLKQRYGLCGVMADIKQRDVYAIGL